MLERTSRLSISLLFLFFCLFLCFWLQARFHLSDKLDTENAVEQLWSGQEARDGHLEWVWVGIAGQLERV